MVSLLVSMLMIFLLVLLNTLLLLLSRCYVVVTTVVAYALIVLAKVDDVISVDFDVDTNANVSICSFVLPSVNFSER
jgi:hypothetical protein